MASIYSLEQFPDFCWEWHALSSPVLAHKAADLWHQSDIVAAATITCGPTKQSTDRRVRSVAPFHVKHAEAH